MPAHRVTETAFFKALRERESVDGFEAAEVSSRVNLVVSETWPVLQNVSRAFPLYTLHDPEHSFRVAENAAQLIPGETLSELNTIELSLLLYAAYLHDIGMASTQEEADAWVESDDYRTFLAAHDEWARVLQAAQHAVREPESGEGGSTSKRERKSGTAQPDHPVDNVKRIQDVMYTEYLRLAHANRSADFVMQRYGRRGKSDNKIQIGEVNYADDVALLCKSHCEDVTTLRDERYRRDKYIKQFPVNLQYCAVILRLADLIDLDPDRTPRVLLDFIHLELHPRDRRTHDPVETSRIKSAEEWEKHRNMRGWKISPDEIRLEAKCSHPVIQRGLKEWCELIDKERRDCWQLVKNNTVDISDKYKLFLTMEVDPSYIVSDGSYIYSDFEFQLDYDRIVSLLMGTELWGNPLLAIRELLQNALDACAHRAALSRIRGVSYEPQVTFRVTWHHDVHAHFFRGRHGRSPFTLSCEDNGTGMDQRIVEKYLMRIGRSYYSSPEFHRQNLDLCPISQFGMGIMSTFMLTNAIRIHTQRRDEELAPQDPLIVEIDSSERYVVMRPSVTAREGTEISMQLSDDIVHDPHPFGDRHFRHHHPFLILDGLDHVLAKLAVHLSIPIQVSNDNRNAVTIEPGRYYLPEIDRSGIPCMGSRFLEFLFEYSHEETGGLAGTFRFLLPLDDKGKPCLQCIAEPVYKMFVDRDLLLTTPGRKGGPAFRPPEAKGDESGDDDWDDDEVRGVYRATYGRKPPVSMKSYDDEVNRGVLEAVRAHFRWSQDGLLVDDLDSLWSENEESDSRKDQQDRGLSRDLFALFRVPGLNAADIDIRDQWRVDLNVQRTRFILGRRSVQNFTRRMYTLSAEMWKRIAAQLLKSHTKQAVKRLLCEVYEASDYECRQALTKILGEPIKSPKGFAERFVAEASQGDAVEPRPKKRSRPRSTRPTGRRKDS